MFLKRGTPVLPSGWMYIRGLSRKDVGLCCGSRLRKGEVFAYVGLLQNLKDLQWMHLLCVTHALAPLQGYLAHKKPPTLGPYRRPMPSVLGGS